MLLLKRLNIFEKFFQLIADSVNRITMNLSAPKQTLVEIEDSDNHLEDGPTIQQGAK